MPGRRDVPYLSAVITIVIIIFISLHCFICLSAIAST